MNIEQKIRNNKGIMKNLAQGASLYNVNDLIKDAKSYIAAIKSGRMLVVIKSVSASGMTRKMDFSACEKAGKGYYQAYYYRSFSRMFVALGYRLDKNHDIVISGCGMDMVFNTNYNIIHKLHKLGFITKSACATLAQKTPAYR